MELRALEYFVAVAEEGSFTAAAARCRIAQPSISQQVKGLEQELGEALFDRGARQVTLSTGGAALLPYARACLAAAEGARSEFAARAGLLTGDLRLGTVEGVEETRIPDLLGVLHRRYPGISVRLTGGTSAPLLARVGQGALDAAVIAGPGEELPESIGSRVLLRDQIVAVLCPPPGVRAPKTLPVARLAREPIITYAADSGLHPLIAAGLGGSGIELRTAYATNDVALHVALARQGIGIALSAGSDPALTRHADVHAVPLRPAIRYEKLLVWRRAQPMSAALRAFLAAWTELIDAG